MSLDLDNTFNFYLMELIKFFNENYLIILSGLLGLFLFKLFTLYKNNSETSNNDSEQNQIDVNEPNYPGHDSNFSPSTNERHISPNNQHQDYNDVPSPNENENNLFDFMLKCYDAIKEEENNFREFMYSLIANDGDPTMFYLFNMSIVLFCILIIIFSLSTTFLIKQFRLEEKEWIKNKDLLYKIVLSYNKIKIVKIYILLVYLIFSVLFCLLLYNFMWVSFWHYK